MVVTDTPQREKPNTYADNAMFWGVNRIQLWTSRQLNSIRSHSDFCQFKIKYIMYETRFVRWQQVIDWNGMECWRYDASRIIGHTHTQHKICMYVGCWWATRMSVWKFIIVNYNWKSILVEYFKQRRFLPLNWLFSAQFSIN